MKYMKKIVICLIVALMALSAILTLVACNISTGFASPEELARAYFEMEKNGLTKKIDGNVMSYSDLVKFYDLSETPNYYLEIYKDMYEIEVAKIKAEVALKKAGNYELSEKNEDGSFKKLSKEDYEKQLYDANNTADSFVFIEARKDDDLTENEQKPNKAIEVWVLEYEYYKYIDGVKADEKTEKKIPLYLIKVDGKWFLNQPLGISSWF